MTLEVRRASLCVRIVDGTATTEIDEVFRNPHGRQVEGTFLLPLFNDAALSKFSMWIDGKEMKGELLDQGQASRIYEDIVRRMQDPALLEYAGSRLFKARVFPIPANGEVRLKLAYTEVLPFDGGVWTYRYALNTNKFSPRPLESCVISVEARSKQALSAVYSPSHALDVQKKDDHWTVASYEAKNVTPDKDFVLYAVAGREGMGLSAVTYRSGGKDGYFLMMMASPASGDGKAMAKDVVFVIDTSGSMMEDKKIEQARRALAFCLKALGPEDRFGVVDFSTVARVFRPGLTAAADKAALEEAVQYVQKLEARGGTNIEEALATALKMAGSGDRPCYVLFVTDGLPTIGMDDPKGLSEKARAQAGKGVRLFTLGVGHDVNAALLDTLAEDNRGARAYVAPGEDMEQKLSSLYAKIAHPALSNVTLTVDKADVYDVFPRTMPDLFHGAQLVVAGRYRRPGPGLVTLRGEAHGKERSFVFETVFAENDAKAENLPRLWALRKVGFLLDEIRLRGMKPELREEVVRLSLEHGILTPYTAYLVTEDRPAPGVRRREAVALRNTMEMMRMAAPSSPMSAADGAMLAKEAKAQVGGGAIAASKQIQAMREGEVSDTFAAAGGQSQMRQVGDRSFYFDGERWIVSGWDKDKATRKVKYLSEEYFSLIRGDKRLAKAFALGVKVIAESEGVYYEVVE